MVDLDLIERALDDAVADAAELLERKLQEYAGREDNPHVALHRGAVILAKDARAEFVKLRKAIEGAPTVGIVEARFAFEMEVGVDDADGLRALGGKIVTLVNCDE